MAKRFREVYRSTKGAVILAVAAGLAALPAVIVIVQRGTYHDI